MAVRQSCINVNRLKLWGKSLEKRMSRVGHLGWAGSASSNFGKNYLRPQRAIATHTQPSPKGQNHIGMQLSTVLENYILTQHGGREIATTTVKQQITLCLRQNWT